MQLWTSVRDGRFDAAVVTKLQDNYCLILTAGGERLEDWVQWLDIIEAWAKDNGCEEMRIYGRIGWSRVLGYNVEYTKMTKKL